MLRLLSRFGYEFLGVHAWRIYLCFMGWRLPDHSSAFGQAHSRFTSSCCGFRLTKTIGMQTAAAQFPSKKLREAAVAMGNGAQPLHAVPAGFVVWDFSDVILQGQTLAGQSLV
jgi:hypothetical protein